MISFTEFLELIEIKVIAVGSDLYFKHIIPKSNQSREVTHSLTKAKELKVHNKEHDELAKTTYKSLINRDGEGNDMQGVRAAITGMKYHNILTTEHSKLAAHYLTKDFKSHKDIDKMIAGPKQDKHGYIDHPELALYSHHALNHPDPKIRETARRLQGK